MTVIPGDTYGERAVTGQLAGRADSSGQYGGVILSTATPSIPNGTFWYHTTSAKLFLNIGSQSVPIFRGIQT